MSISVDISVLELLASKICHDLISPIGAVNNGIEFMTEMGEDAGDEVTDLISYSAQQASSKLQAYRMAYGAGGADGSLKPEDVYKVIEGLVAPDAKTKQDWDPYGDLGYDERPDAFCKIFVCVMLLAMECLPKGGVISVEGAGKGQTAVIAKGPNAAPRDQAPEVLGLNVHHDALKPQYTHPYMTGLLAKTYGFDVSFGTLETDSVTILITHP